MLVPLSGCGGSSSSSSSAATSGSSSTSTTQTTQSAAHFKAAIAPVLNEFKSASQGTGAALQKASSQSDAQLGAEFQQLAAKWQAGLTKLETLQAPPQFSAAFTRLKGQISHVKTDLTTIASAAKSHDVAGAKTAVTKLVNDIVSAKATATTISNGSP
jgi:hypothetical protein